MGQKEATVELEIKLRLPGDVAREAEASGLLEAESLESLLREELRRRRVGHLFATADCWRLSPAPLDRGGAQLQVQAARPTADGPMRAVADTNVVISRRGPVEALTCGP